MNGYYFSKKVECKRSIVAATGFREVSNLGAYLDVSLLGQSPWVSDFNYVVDAIKNKLTDGRPINFLL